jgi:hypothetical protein
VLEKFHCNPEAWVDGTNSNNGKYINNAFSKRCSGRIIATKYVKCSGGAESPPPT